MKRDMRKQLKSIIEQATQAGEIPGASLLVTNAEERQQLYVEAGMADIENGIPYRKDTIVRLYSLTKPITAAAALLLVERGVLELWDEIGKWIPAYKDLWVYSDDGQKHPAKRPLTVKDLLSMTSGLPYGYGENPAARAASKVFDELEASLDSEAPWTTRQTAEKLAGCGLSFQPGERFMYGTSADIMGAVIEEASGLRFGEFLQQEFFKPLQMRDTDFYVPPEKQHRLAKAYQTTEHGLAEVQTKNLGLRYLREKPPEFESGGAGLVSTLDDYTRFTQMLLANGQYRGRQILSPHSVQYLSAGQLLPWQQESFLNQDGPGSLGHTYGCFNRILIEPGQAAMYGIKGEYGWDGWLGCYFCNIPLANTSIVIFTQRTDSGLLPVVRKLKNTIITNL